MAGAPLEPVGKPELEVVDDRYRFTWPSGIVAELERFSEHRDELSAELTIYSGRQPNAGLVHSARLNLMSTQTRDRVAAACAKREPELAWDSMLEQLCFLARDRYRAGEPSVDLRELEPAIGTRWRLEPFIEQAGPTVLFADGGSGKSILGLAMAMTVASGHPILGCLHGPAAPVLYLDWETDSATAYERMTAIAAGANLAELPPVFYRRQVASLIESAGEIRREITRLGAGLVVVDSLGAARGGEPESADITIRTFVAARSLGVPWLGIDHVTKANGNNGTRPFGSTYTHNLARLTWGADKAQEEGEDHIVVSLANFKRNNGRRLARLGYRIAFDNDGADALRAVRFTKTDLAGVPGLAEKLPLRQRILAELRQGPMTLSVLAEELGQDIRAVSARAGEMVKGGELVRLEDRRVALAARAS